MPDAVERSVCSEIVIAGKIPACEKFLPVGNRSCSTVGGVGANGSSWLALFPVGDQFGELGVGGSSPCLSLLHVNESNPVDLKKFKVYSGTYVCIWSLC